MNVSALSSALRQAPVAREISGDSNPGIRTVDAAADRRKVAAQFEAILVRQMLGQSVGSMLGGDSVAGSVYGDMMTDALAQQLTAGAGLGLGRMIEKQLTPRGSPAASNPTLSHP